MTRRTRAERRIATLYLLPSLVALGTFTLYPAGWVLWLSLQHRIVVGLQRVLVRGVLAGALRE
jgi:ABC-type sugar transport system permease subunit